MCYLYSCYLVIIGSVNQLITQYDSTTPPDNYNYDRHILNNHVHLTKQIINKWKHPG